MSPLSNQILHRYQHAASVIAGELSMSIQSEKNGGLQAQTGLMNADSQAAEQLLRRQAHALLELHKDLIKPDGQQNTNRNLLQNRLDDLASMATSRFYSYRYDQLPYHWRQIYTDSLILKTYDRILQCLLENHASLGETLDFVVEHLDRAVITAGGAGKKLGLPWIEKTLKMLEDLWRNDQAEGPPSKRRKINIEGDNDRFPSDEPYGRMTLLEAHECPRYEGWSLDKFETYMNAGEGKPLPIVFTDLTKTWPAMTNRPWNDPRYLLSHTFGGRRLVPVELGRSYVDEGWGQELMSFKDFLGRYVTEGNHEKHSSRVGYLAQHDLFRQIPSLRSDIQVPDFCWAAVPGHPTNPSKNQPTVDVPQLNAWFGPARTITPLHTDGYHNLLCQVVGTKYVRLYPPHATSLMKPRLPEHGVDMSNTSELDVGVLEGWDRPPEGVDEEELRKMREELRDVDHWECILSPGETLVIPVGWWHYVRSLSVSFSVSFWWN